MASSTSGKYPRLVKYSAAGVASRAVTACKFFSKPAGRDTRVASVLYADDFDPVKNWYRLKMDIKL